MVAAGGTALMATSEGNSSKVAENISSQYEAQQSAESLVRRTTRSGSTDSIKKKDSVKNPLQNKTAWIRETKASRLRAASIVSPVDASNLPRRTGFSESVSSWNTQSANLLNKQKSPVSSSTSLSARSKDKYQSSLSEKLPESDEKSNEPSQPEKIECRSKRLIRPNLVSRTSTLNEVSSSNSSCATSVHRRHNDSKDNSRRVSSQQSTSDTTARGSQLASSSGMKRSSTHRSGRRDNTTEVLQRVDALTALTRATMERVERLTSSSSSYSHAITPINSRSTTIRGDFHSSNVPIVTSKSRSTAKHSSKTVGLINSSSSSSQTNPTTNNSSILKTINDEIQVMSCNRNQTAPISILKHKAFENQNFQYTGQSRPTVVMTVNDDTSITKKHGILKKRSSLDECEILRRKSYSTDVFAEINNFESRRILNIERRSSLDELVKRPRSPESLHLTSILKRKSSAEEDREDVVSSEPQSILKRPSSSGGKSNSTGHHSGIAALAVTKTLGGVEYINNSMVTEPRPILKKKISRDESSSSDPPSLEPRPILKKKSSTESDEHDDRQIKTILKSSRKSSEESSNESEAASPKNLSVLKNRALQRRTNSLPECDAVRPILKNSSGRSRSSDITPRDLCLRKRARSVGEHTSTDNSTGMYDSRDTLLDVECRLTPNSSRCNNFVSSIAPIVSFKLPSSDDELVYCDTNTEDDSTNDEATLRKLDEGIARLRRARHISRRYRDRRIELANVTNTDYHEAPELKSMLSVSEMSRIVGENQDDDLILQLKEPENQIEVTDSTQQHRNDECDRLNTQPVTTDAEIQEEQIANPLSFGNTLNPGMKNHDDPSKLSLVDRVKLFNRKIATESVAKVGFSLERAQRRPLSRFRTQPVTSEEVEVAVKSIPSTIADLKRISSETVESGSAINEAINPDALKSILKSSSSHVLNIRQKSLEFIDTPNSCSDPFLETGIAHKYKYSTRQEPVIVKRKDDELFNETTDVNDGLMVQNKNSQLMSIIDDTTVPSSDYIDSVSITSESAITRKRTRQRIFISTNRSECIDENSHSIDIPTRSISSVQNFDLPNMSIADRLAALQRSGSSDWKRRVTNEQPVPSVIMKKSIDCNNKEDDVGQKEKDELAIKQRRLADRLEKLESAAEGWRKRIAVTDAIKFSVAGKMSVEQPESFNLPSKSLLESMGNCVSDRKKKIPRPEQYKKGNSKDMTSFDVNEELLSDKILGSSSKKTSDDSGEESKMSQPYLIQCIPRADDETFTSFFESVSVDKCREESIDIAESDFDDVRSYSELLGARRTTRVHRRRVPSRNPLRTLAARTDLKDEYIEITTGVADRVMKMTNIEKLAQNSSLAVEALAGLASNENFNLVTLRNIGDDIGFGGKLRPYKDLMLILVKGRRHVQVRLVEPVASNVNSGDNYILITKTELYHYVGKYSNVIEKSRAAEIALRIVQHKDLGCRAPRVVTIEDKISSSTSKNTNFWRLLGETGENTAQHVIEAGHPDEDEIYESAMIDTNAVYEVMNDVLLPLEKYWGAIPKIKMLDPSKILVFDFGSEMYIWNGKITSTEQRKVASRLARELWNEGYDYSECTVCPIDAASMIGNRLKSETGIKNALQRPDWCLLGKLTQHMETILFREKFLDWPNVAGMIRINKPDDKEQIDCKIIIEPPDVDTMIAHKECVVDLILEGSHLGRGDGWYDAEFNRQYIVATTDVTVWHIDEYSSSLLCESSKGQFYTGDSYIVRWMYTITVTGRELSGLPSKHAVEGRDRCAYFIWQGKCASLNKQGTAALLTVELDKEQGPQIRVAEGFEPAAFLNLFKGKMVIHSGKKSDDRSEKTSRTFILRGAKTMECSLIEVSCSPRQLRSRGSLVFLDNKTEKIRVWHGRHSLSHVRQNAVYAANQLCEYCPCEAGLNDKSHLTVDEIYEGEEPAEFLQGIMGKLHMTLNRKSIPRHTPRLFYFSSISGEFTATEIMSPQCSSDTITPFPFLQDELYQVNQPALFLLDNKDELWLWQGWWPDTGSDDQTGSGAVRWQAERRAAMTVAIEYWKKLNPNTKKCSVFLVWAGLEPLEFINLFPTWTDRDEIAELNITDGRAPGEILSVESELARLMQSTYPPAQLLQRPLPEGVDPTTLELYLSPQHFEELLGMNIEEFQQLPFWKQIDMKKKIGLF